MRSSLPLRFALGVLLNEPEEENISGMNILALMFRQIKGDLNISSRSWSLLMNQYLKDPRNEVLQTSRGRSSERSNLNRGLTNPGLTFKNFMKGLRLLAPQKVTMKLDLEFDNEVTVSTSVNIDEEMLYMPFHNEKYPDRQNFLATMFRNIKNTLEINDEQWRKLMSAYLNNPLNGFVETKELKGGAKSSVVNGGKRSSERSNLTRGLSNPDMSIKVFTKGLKVLNPKQIYFKVRLEYSGGRSSPHFIRVAGNALVAVEGEE